MDKLSRLIQETVAEPVESCESEAGPSGPDWQRVGFEVPCLECGDNLHGESETVCQGCGLAFDWERVLPLEHVRCPKCNYQLLGLNQPRCPECGTQFEWSQVLETARQKGSRFFEFLWFDNPVPSFAYSMGQAALRPGRLWRDYRHQANPQVIPLLVFVLFQWAVFGYGWTVTAWAVDPLMNGIASWAETRLRFVYPFRLGIDGLLVLVLWHVASFLAIQLFFQTKRRLGIRWTDTLRVYAHATVIMAFCPAAWCVLEALLDSTLFINRWTGGDPNSPAYLWLAGVVFGAGLLATWGYMTIGFRRGLRMPHAGAVSATCILLGFLLVLGMVV